MVLSKRNWRWGTSFATHHNGNGRSNKRDLAERCFTRCIIFSVFLWYGVWQNSRLTTLFPLKKGGKDDGTVASQSRQLKDSINIVNNSNSHPKAGFAACLMLLDDTIRLLEWTAYHFTTLPLTSLIIGTDPRTSPESIAEYELMSRNYANHGLNITIWPTDPTPRVYDFESYRKGDEKKEQFTDVINEFYNSCTHHYLERLRKNNGDRNNGYNGSEEWLLLTDSDELLSYNFIQPNENTSTYFTFDENSIFASQVKGKKGVFTKEETIQNRIDALQIRLQLEEYDDDNVTITSFINDRKADVTQNYFPSESGCNRLVALKYGTDELKSTPKTPTPTPKYANHNLLMTKRYPYHSAILTDRFSKVMLELPKLIPGHLSMMETVHNPFPNVCGLNGAHTSGMDYTSSVLKLSHYVASLESYRERGGGKGTVDHAPTEEAWRMRHEEGAPYVQRGDEDWRMGRWVERFERLVGEEGAEKLLFEPLSRRIDAVVSNLKKEQRRV